MAIPSWFKVNDENHNVTEVKKTMAVASTIFKNKKLETMLVNLLSRWMDEKEYEDFKDYKKVIQEFVVGNFPDVQFVKATKRPFGFVVNINEVGYHFKMNTMSFSYKRLLFSK